MSFKRSLIALAIALAGQFVTGVAYGWGVGGSIVSDFKQGDNDLYCALAAPGSKVIVIATVNPEKTFSLQGQNIRCWEVAHGTSAAPSGSDFRFDLEQVQMVGGGSNGADVDASTCPPDCAPGQTLPDHVIRSTTWSFKVRPKTPQIPPQILLWRLTPANDEARTQFCQGIPDPQQCGVNVGLGEQIPGHYPFVPVTGPGHVKVELSVGEIFRFTTETYDDGHEETTLGWRACHSGQFDLNQPVACGFGSAKPTKARGAGRGKP